MLVKRSPRPAPLLVVLFLLAVLGSACSASRPPGVDAFAVGGGLFKEGDGITSPIWDGGVPSWFNGIWLMNQLDEDVVLESIRVLDVDPAVEVFRIVVARWSDMPPGDREAFTGECGDMPPPGYPWLLPSGVTVITGDRILPLVGVRNPDSLPGGLRQLRVNYSVAGRSFVQDVHFSAKYTTERRKCSPSLKGPGSLRRTG